MGEVLFLVANVSFAMAEPGMIVHAYFHPSSPDKNDAYFEIEVRNTGGFKVEVVELPQEQITSLFSIDGAITETWKRKALPAFTPPNNRLSAVTFESGDTINLTVPLSKYFSQYEILEQGALDLGFPIPILQKDANLFILTIEQRNLSIYPQPPTWSQHPEAKRVLYEFFHLLKRGEIKAIRAQLYGHEDEALHQSTDDYLKKLHSPLKNDELRFRILDAKESDQIAVISVKLMIPKKRYEVVPFFLARDGSHWRLIPQNADPQARLQALDNGAEPLMEWFEKSKVDYERTIKPGRTRPSTRS